MNQKIKRLRNLPQNYNKSDQELAEIVAANADTDIEVLAKLSDKTEKKLAKTLLSEYLNHFDIENVSDRGTLGQLVYLEVVQYRLQDKMNDLYRRAGEAISMDLLEAFQHNSDAILKMKTALGLNRPKTKESAYNVLEHLKHRHQIWMSENQASRHFKCPHCFQMIWTKIRMDVWDAQRHPFFRDTFLYNRALFDALGKTITITREFLASVFETSPDYINHTVERIQKESYSGPKEETSEEVSKENPEVIINDALIESVVVGSPPSLQQSGEVAISLVS